MDTVKQIDTPYNNAVSVINKANDIYRENGILDSTGLEVAQLEQSPANPAWIYALACGSLHTSWQERLAKAYACLDAQSCEDDQVLVLASLAGVERGNGTPSHITVEIRNTSPSEITVAAGTIFSEQYSNNNWGVARTFTLAAKDEAGDSIIATLYNSIDGAYFVPAGVSFTSEDFPALQTVSEADSLVGEDIESIASLRNKISQGKETKDPVLKAETAIAQLSGIESCSIWFNDSTVDNKVIGTGAGQITISPRSSYVAIKGVDISGSLAETYYKYLNVPTISLAESPTNVTELYQRGMQQLSVSFEMSKEVAVPVTIYINKADMAVGAEAAIAAEVMRHSGSLASGENLTAQKMSEWLQNLGYGTIIGCYVGENASVTTAINPNEYVVFQKELINVSAIGGE